MHRIECQLLHVVQKLEEGENKTEKTLTHTKALQNFLVAVSFLMKFSSFLHILILIVMLTENYVTGSVNIMIRFCLIHFVHIIFTLHLVF